MQRTIIMLTALVLSGSAYADELNDMPELACARASSDLEREQIGCREASLSPASSRREAPPRERSEDR